MRLLLIPLVAVPLVAVLLVSACDFSQEPPRHLPLKPMDGSPAVTTPETAEEDSLSPEGWCTAADSVAEARTRKGLYPLIRVDCDPNDAWRYHFGPQGLLPGSLTAERSRLMRTVNQSGVLAQAKISWRLYSDHLASCLRLWRESGEDPGRCYHDAVGLREIAYAVTEPAWEDLWGNDRGSVIHRIEAQMVNLGWLEPGGSPAADLLPPSNVEVGVRDGGGGDSGD